MSDLLPWIFYVLLSFAVGGLGWEGVQYWRARRTKRSAQLPTDLQSHRARQAEVERLREHALRHFYNNREAARRRARMGGAEI